MNPTSDTKPPVYFTRKAGAQYIRDERGIPLTESRFDKDAATGIAPKPAAQFGRRHLYTAEQLLEEYVPKLIKLADKDENAAA